MTTSIARTAFIAYNSNGVPTKFVVDDVSYQVPASFPNQYACKGSTVAVSVTQTSERGVADGCTVTHPDDVAVVGGRRTTHTSLTKA